MHRSFLVREGQLGSSNEATGLAGNTKWNKIVDVEYLVGKRPRC